MEEQLLKLKEYLKDYTVDVESLTDKELLQILKRMIFNYKVDKDWEELLYTKMPENGKTEEAKLAYTEKMQNLDVKIVKAMSYKEFIKFKINRDKKQKRKETFQKVLSKFKKTK